MNDDDVFGIGIQPLADVLGESEHVGQGGDVMVVYHEPEKKIL